MTAKWIGTAALVAFAMALALVPSTRYASGNVGSSTDIGPCAYSDPLVPCGATLQWGVPIGDGLFAIAVEDFL